jgi:Transposase IS4
LELLERGSEKKKVRLNSQIELPTREELRTFVGIILFFGVKELPEIDMYWETRLGLGEGLIRNSIISRDRFYEISKILHIDEDPGDSTPTKKVNLLFNHLMKRFGESFGPGAQLSLDEAMIHFEGRSLLRVNLPSKPIPEGIKVYCICDAKTGYLLHSTICVGNSTLIEIAEELVKNFQNQGRILYLDNYYSSFPLFDKMKDMGVYCLGTFRRDRIPTNLRVIWSYEQMNKWEKGVFEWTVSDDKLVVALKDNGCVIFGTNHQQGLNLQTSIRKDRAGNQVMYQWPSIVNEYNDWMGGVDILDQRRSYYTAVTRKNRVWWKKIFYFLIEVATINCWILSTFHQTGTGTYLEFKVHLIRQLIELKSGFSAHLSQEHWPSHTEKERNSNRSKRLNCKLCYSKLGKAVQVTTQCQKCEAPLHLECFQEWHTQNQFC